MGKVGYFSKYNNASLVVVFANMFDHINLLDYSVVCVGSDSGCGGGLRAPLA